MKLLRKNNSCSKCHHLLVYYQSKHCPNNFPDATMYKTLTSHNLEIAQCNDKRIKKPITITVHDLQLKGDNINILNLITIIMGQSISPITYMPPNLSNMIKGSSDSDEVSLPVCASVNPAPSLIARVAPFWVPHLYWKCRTDGPANSFSVIFNALFDNGSHTVLISKLFANLLCLHCQKLPRPETVGVARKSGKGWVHVE